MRTDADLPPGFRVRLHADVRRRGPVLVGGDPATRLTLRADLGAAVAAGVVEVSDTATARLARVLLRTGMAYPEVMRGDSAGAEVRVSAVIPVKDDPTGLARLLAALADPAVHAGRIREVIVVDDGSEEAVVAPVVAPRRGLPPVRVLRHPVARGPAAARNAGVAVAGAAAVVFLDADTVPRPGWLEPLLAHLADPEVVAVAPRIVPLVTDGGALTRYEAMRSALDMGRRPARVRPGTRLTYVPSAAMLIRREGFPGFDESMHVAEDVDLCWRMVAAGGTVRYEPRSHVAHDHRTRFGPWLRRRGFYGLGAAPLGERHGAAVAPVVLPPWGAVAGLGVVSVTRTGAAVAAASTVWAWTRTRRVVEDPAVAAGLVGAGLLSAIRQIASTSVRTHLPVTLPFAAGSRWVRRRLIAAAVFDAIADRVDHFDRDGAGMVLDPVRYGLFKRAEDAAYGVGVWASAWRARDPRALLPVIRTGGGRGR